MATLVTYARPSYKDIANSIREQMNEKDLLLPLSYESMMLWILEACQQLTQRLDVLETKQLRLIQGVSDYYFQDTTGVIPGTGTFNSTGINVVGITAVGTGTVSYNANNVSIGFPNGTVTNAVVTGLATTFIAQLQVGMMLTVNGESHEIMAIQSNGSLYVDQGYSTTFTNQAFTYSTTRFRRELVSGSVMTVGAVLVTVGTVVDGQTVTLVNPPAVDIVAGSFTIDYNVNEIPTRMRNDLYKIDRIESNFHRQIDIKQMDYLLDVQRFDLYAVYTNYNTPYMCAIARDNFQRYYLHFYPFPDTTKEITLYSYVKVMPRLYLITDTLTSPIPIDENFEPAIRLYVEAKTRGWIKQAKESSALMAQFYAMIKDMRTLGREEIGMRITYT